MSQNLNLKLKGLYVSNNELGSNPEGALSLADDVVIDFDDIAQSRRGFDTLEFRYANGSDRASRYTSYQSKLISHYGPYQAATTVAHYDNATGWINYAGTYNNPDNDFGRTRFLEVNQNLYWTASDGIHKIDAFDSPPIQAGASAGLDIQTTTDGSSGFMPDDSQIAYRLVWGYKDLNNNLILGAPSQRAVVINTSGGTVNTSSTFSIPEEITTNYFFQLYRSPASATALIEPLDEMQLVYESNPTSGEIVAGTITVVDITPDSLKGATLYTSPSQEGITQANTQPVFAYDFCSFKGFTMYANVASKQRLNLTIIAVGSPNGVQIGDVLTINGIDYTAAASENIAAGEFEVVTSGTPAQNITDTTNSLVRVINRYDDAVDLYAYYTSGYNELPGRILLQARVPGGPVFSVTVDNNGTAYSPNLPSVGTTVNSTNDRYKNGIYISKLQQPEAVPLVNLLFAGSASQDILRIVPLRDSVFILKKDGIFRITGSDLSNFAIDPFDTTVRILAPDSAVVLANEVWFLSDQGVVSVSDSGVNVKSRPIESQLILLFGTALNNLRTMSFGISYETERKYILFTVVSDASTAPDQAYVFNTFTNTWTRWNRNQTAGFVNPTNNMLYLGDAASTFTNVERKSYTYTDFIDELIDTYTVSAISTDGLTLTLDTVANLTVGDLVFKSPTITAIIIDIDLTNVTITVSAAPGFTVGTVDIYKAINCIIEWQPTTADNPGQTKQFPEVSTLFRSTRFFRAKFGFRTELSQNLETVNVDGTPPGGWGLFPWGSSPWGGSIQPKALRTYVPANKQVSAQIVFRVQLRNGYSDWKLLGVSFPFNEISTEVTK